MEHSRYLRPPGGFANFIGLELIDVLFGPHDKVRPLAKYDLLGGERFNRAVGEVNSCGLINPAKWPKGPLPSVLSS